MPKGRMENLPHVLNRHVDGHYVYDPALGVTGSKRAARIARGTAIRRFLESLEEVGSTDLRKGDHVYVELTRHVSDESPDGKRSSSGYLSSHYLCKVVEEGGRLWFEGLTRMPAQPAASRTWHQPGFRIPISPHEKYHRVE